MDWDLSIGMMWAFYLCFRTEPSTLCTMKDNLLFYSSATNFLIHWQEVFAFLCHLWFSALEISFHPDCHSPAILGQLSDMPQKMEVPHRFPSHPDLACVPERPACLSSPPHQCTPLRWVL